MAKTNDEEPTAAQQREHMRRQAEAAKRHKEQLKQEGKSVASVSVSTMLTDEGHRGKIAAEPDKPSEESQRALDEEERTGVERVRTRTRKTPGKGATDEVVTVPETDAARGATDSPETEAHKVHKVAHRSGKKSRKK